MAKSLISLVLLCASLLAQVTGSGTPTAGDGGNARASSVQSVNSVIEWNRTLLVIVRTPGAQLPTIHSTRSFAILHAAIYDAVNNLDPVFNPYLILLPDVSRRASRLAARVPGAHDVLGCVSPAFPAPLQAALQQDLAQISDVQNRADGIAIGPTVGAHILSLRRNHGSGVTPPLFVAG